MAIIARRIERFFFPHRKILRLFKENYSPDLLRKIVYAGVHCSSFEGASENLNILGEVFVSKSHMQRLTIRIGEEFALQGDQSADCWEDIPERNNTPIEVASVSVDGGRAQIRSEDCGGGVHNPRWVETRVACLQVLESKEYLYDPHPMLPRIFVDKKAVKNIVEGLKGARKKVIDEDSETKNDVPLPAKKETTKQTYGPAVIKKFAVATVDNNESFGNLVLYTAHQHHLHTAKRKAYLGDGDIKIWTMYDDYFRQEDWVPILDFVHAVEYAYEAAKLSTGSDLHCWAKYIEFATHIWQGRVLSVMRKIDKSISTIKSKDIRERLESIRNYFKNNYTKMDYPKYRRKGLPVSSCHVESLIKQFNLRIKSTEKFWNKSSLVGVLRIKASFLSQNNPLKYFWNNRFERQVNSKRSYYLKAA